MSVNTVPAPSDRAVRRPRRSATVGAAILGGAAMLFPAACSPGPPGPPDGAPEIADAWRVQIDREVEAGFLSEFERDVLADYWVTDEEYARAREPIPGCMAERGFEAILHPDGGIDVGADPQFWGGRDLADPAVEAAMDMAMNECQAGLMGVEAYYWDMRSNPEAWDFWEALVRCAERFGLTEGAGMSTEELKVAVLESEEFLAECRFDPWSLAQGREPVGGYEGVLEGEG